MGGSDAAQPPAATAAGTEEREALAAALDALAAAVEAAQDRLRAAAPATRALIDEHGFWLANAIWTDGFQVAKAARLLAALLRRGAGARGAARKRRPGSRAARDRR